MGFFAEEANVDEDADELGEALVAESSADNGLSFGDVVSLFEWCRISVGICYEGKARVDEVGFCRSHELGARYLLNFPIAVVPSRISEGEQNASA